MKYLALLLSLMVSLNAETLNVSMTHDASQKDKNLIVELSKQFDVKMQNVDLATALNNVQTGVSDIAIGNITINAQRESVIDFTIPYNNSPVKLLKKDTTGMWNKCCNFFGNMIIPAALFVVFLIISGMIFSVLEKDLNGDNNDEGFLAGAGHGIWLSLNLSSTSGLGDVAPKTISGRIFAAFIMMSGIMYFGAIIGISAASWNKASVQSYSMGELKQQKVATIRNTSSHNLMTHAGNEPKLYDNIDKCMVALYKGEVDSVMYDECVLNDYVKDDYKVLKDVYLPQQYGIAVTQHNADLRDKINAIIGESK